MKKILKRAMVMFLVVSVAVCASVVTAHAEETEQLEETVYMDDTTVQEETGCDCIEPIDTNELDLMQSDEDIVYEKEDMDGYATVQGGVAGSVYWSFNQATGTLRIYGNGSTGDYKHNPYYPSDYTPWHSYRDQIKKLVIEEGVTGIGDNAFYFCNNIESFSIPNSLTRIGYWADIGGVTDELYISQKLTCIKNRAFGDVQCNKITVDPRNSVYDSRNNCNAIIETATNKLIKGCVNTIIPKGVTMIDEAAMVNYPSVLCLPLSVKNIGPYNFNGPNVVLTDVYYEGTYYDRQKISCIYSVCRELQNATWHYNCSGTFWDISTTEDWFYSSAEYVYSRGIMTGMGDTGGFAPGDPLHREQLAVMLYRLENSPSTSYTSKFPDVPNGTWYSLPIIWAYQKGIITGYQDGRFGVGDNITREQLAVMLYRYADNYKHLNVSNKADISGYKDASSVSSWAKDAIRWAVGSGIITGKDNGTRLDPQGNAARCECAAMIQRFMVKYRL